MRIDYLHLEAFGHFTDFKLLFDEDKNFHILYGPNEAGKSTILRSVSNFFYGFPQQTADSFLHDNQKLRIGGQLKNKQGETLPFIRRKGRKNTALNLENQPLDEKNIQQFLNGMSEQQFLTMFALDHLRLREGGESLLQSDGNVGESLFSAASGISVLRNVLEELESASRDFYLKNGSKPAINQALKEEKELTKQINENQLKVQAWKKLENDFFDGEEQIETLKRDYQALGMKEMKYRRLKQTLPKIALRQETIEKRKELKNIPDFPEQAEEARRENLQIIENAETKRKEAVDKITQIDSQLVKLSIPDGLIDQEAKIEGLNREVDGYCNNCEQLPILQGEQRQLEQQVLSTLKELDAANNSLDAIDSYRISVAKKKAISQLSDQYPLLEQERKTAEKKVSEIKKDLKKQSEELEDLGEVVDVTKLDQAINQVKEEGKIESLLQETDSHVQQLEQEITDLIDRLPLWNGTSEALTQLQVPSLTNTIKKYDKKHQDLVQEMQQIKQKIKSENQSIEANEERMRELESLADIPTEELLQELREQRDAGWLVIRNKLNDHPVDDQALQAFTQGLPLDLVFEKSMSKSDDTADLMRREAEKLGEKNKLISDIEANEKNIEALEIEQANVERALERWQKAWGNEWNPASINPLSPEEMIEWIEKYNHILSLISDKQKLGLEGRTLANKQVQLTASLRASLAEFGKLSEAMTLAELTDKAEKVRNDLTERKSRRNHLQDTIRDLDDKLDRAEDNRKLAVDQINEWNEKWRSALDGITLSVDTSPVIVKELIETYEGCVRDFEKLKQTEKHMQTIKQQMNLFHEKVDELDHNLPQATDDMVMDVVVTQVYQALNQAKQDKIKLDNLIQQKEDVEQDKKLAETEIKEANEKLNELMEQAGCDTLDKLEKIEEAFNQKKAYTEKIIQLEQELVEIGNGLSLEQLLAEAESVDNDLIDYQLDELTRKKRELDTNRSEFEQNHGVVKREYNQKIEGANFASVQAAEEKESVLAKISTLTDQYVNHKLASLLLKKGIDYYREQNQSPIMNRASDIFQRLTLYSFDGITVDFDEKDQPVIMGVRNGDEKVKLSGMSDGTIDQLYLALRIASIEKYVFENEPIPFIVDDILVHFDDERSKETLKVLLELSKHTQVIFFTHHSKLIELLNDVSTESIFQQTEIQTTKSSVLT